MRLLAPRLAVAAEKSCDPGIEIVKIPVSPVTAVRDSARMSATGVADAERTTVVSVGTAGAGGALSHRKRTVTSVGGNGPTGVNDSTKLCREAGAMSTGVFRGQMVPLVAGSVGA